MCVHATTVQSMIRIGMVQICSNQLAIVYMQVEVRDVGENKTTKCTHSN